MNWIEKLSVAAAACRAGTLKYSLQLGETGTAREVIGGLQKEYPFLPQSYLSMLLAYDGLSISSFVFFGSEQGIYPSLARHRQLWKRFVNLDDKFAMAKDPADCLLCLDSAGMILCLDVEPPYEQHSVAEDFDEFMNDFIFGRRYLEYEQIFGEPLNRSFVDDDEWAQFLVEHGWLQASK